VIVRARPSCTAALSCLQTMRVLAGFESSWTSTAGRDRDSHRPGESTSEAGAWQVSAGSMGNGQELKTLVQAKVGSLEALHFQRAIKHNHPLAMEYITRVLRRTVGHNGPIKAHRIDIWLRKDAVAEFLDWSSPPGRPMDDIDIPQMANGRWR
jgi:hypothetical protein